MVAAACMHTNSFLGTAVTAVNTLKQPGMGANWDEAQAAVAPALEQADVCAAAAHTATCSPAWLSGVAPLMLPFGRPAPSAWARHRDACRLASIQLGPELARNLAALGHHLLHWGG